MRKIYPHVTETSPAKDLLGCMFSAVCFLLAGAAFYYFVEFIAFVIQKAFGAQL